jgi:hypothetical protein
VHQHLDIVISIIRQLNGQFDLLTVAMTSMVLPSEAQAGAACEPAVQFFFLGGRFLLDRHLSFQLLFPALRSACWPSFDLPVS